jgi:stress response protein YsnF
MMAQQCTSQSQAIAIVEERAVVHKEVEVTGAIRVTKRVHVERRPVSADLASEQVEVERVPCDRIVEGPIPERQEGDTLVLSVVEEVPVVVIRYRLVEEVRITRRQRIEAWEDTVPVRRIEVATERLDPPGADEVS